MGEIGRSLLRAGAIAMAILGLMGCTVGSSPIARQVEARLLRGKMSDAEFGARISPKGERIQFTMFTGKVLPTPVLVPMSTRFRGLPAVEARLNGRQTIRMLVDTGAQLSIIDASNVLASGGRVYVPQKWDFTVTGVGGSEQAWLARFDEVTIGSLVLRNFTTVARRERTAVRLGGLFVGAIPINLLGCPVLLGFNYVTFDYGAKRFVFSPGQAFQPSPGARRIPLLVQEQLLYVPLRIGNRVIPAMVDTGARDQIFLNSETVRSLGLEAHSKTGGSYRALGLGGETSGRQFNVPLMFIGDVPVQNVTVDTSESSSWTARIGNDLLERWKVTFDFSGRAMWLEARAP
jgi:predicted aspartyl protease